MEVQCEFYGRTSGLSFERLSLGGGDLSVGELKALEGTQYPTREASPQKRHPGASARAHVLLSARSSLTSSA